MKIHSHRILAGIAVFLVFLLSVAPAETASVFPDLLPPDTLVMLDVTDVPGQAAALQKSRLYRELVRIRLPRIPGREDAADVNLLLDRFSRFSENSVGLPEFAAVLGKKTCLALLSDVQDKSGDGTDAYDAGIHPSRFENPWLFISVPEPGADADALLKQACDTVELLPDTIYRGIALKHRMINDRLTVVFASIDGFLVAGYREAVAAAIDASLSGKRLSGNQAYKRVVSKLTRPCFAFAYINVPGVLAAARAGLECPVPANRTGTYAPVPETFWHPFMGITAMGTVFYQETPGFFDTLSVTLMDDQCKGPLLKSLLTTQPEKSPMNEMTPRESLAYYWQNTFDIKTILTSSFSDEEMIGLSRKITAATGRSPDDLSRALGNQLGVVLRQVHLGGMFPIPEIALVLKVTDRKTIDEALIRSVTATGPETESGLVLHQTRMADTDVRFVVLPFGSQIRPAYAFRNGYLIIASNLDLMGEMLTLEAADRAITGSSGYSRVAGHLNKPANQILYLDLERMNHTVRELLLQVSGFMRLSGPEKAAEFNLFLDAVGMPVLRALSRITHESARSWANDNTLYYEARFSIDTDDR